MEKRRAWDENMLQVSSNSRTKWLGNLFAADYSNVELWITAMRQDYVMRVTPGAVLAWNWQLDDCQVGRFPIRALNQITGSMVLAKDLIMDIYEASTAEQLDIVLFIVFICDTFWTERRQFLLFVGKCFSFISGKAQTCN